MNHYLLPDAPCSINFSGGRSSGYMLWHILDAYDGKLPKDIHVVFNNTGMEREETLVFVKECAERWNVPIRWLQLKIYDEFMLRINRAAGRKMWRKDVVEVDFETASRKGEVFESLIRYQRMLPHVVSRFCTSEMKIGTTRRFMQRKMGYPKFHPVVGFRGDEPHRLKNDIDAPGELARVFPMACAGVTKQDVAAFWKRQPFDLGIPSWMGNCTLCFLKGQSNLKRTIQLEPHLADWWIRQERWRKVHWSKIRHPDLERFNQSFSYAELKRQALAQRDLFPFEDEGGIDCVGCTD